MGTMLPNMEESSSLGTITETWPTRNPSGKRWWDKGSSCRPSWGTTSCGLTTHWEGMDQLWTSFSNSDPLGRNGPTLDQFIKFYIRLVSWIETSVGRYTH